MSSRSLRRAVADFHAVKQAVDAHHPFIKAVSLTNSAADENNEGDSFHWLVTVLALPESVYAGHTYDLLITLSPDNFPQEPPAVRVLTPIFSPVVAAEDGKLCDGILRDNYWRPSTRMLDCIAHLVQCIFVDYDTLGIINEEAGHMSRGTAQDKEAFRARVHQVRNSACK